MPPPSFTPDKEQVDFPHPSVVVDTFLSEQSSSYIGTYTPVEPGTPYQNANHSQAQAAQYQALGLISLSQKAGKDREFQERFWASIPKTQDIYNYALTYSGKANTFPIFKRRYLELRDTYQARDDLSPFTGVFAITITAGGLGYTNPVVTITDAGTGTGATAIAIISPVDGSIAKITIKSEGQNYTPGTIMVSIADSMGGIGSGATAFGVVQPSLCLLIDEEANPAQEPWGSLYMMVDRTYETLPGPVFYDIPDDPELGIPVMTTTQRRAATDVWALGEIAPVSFAITGVNVAPNTTITPNSSPVDDIEIGEFVVVAGTANTTPSINGTWKVVGLDQNFGTITINAPVTVISGPVGGTIQRYSYFTAERRKTDNTNVYERVTTRALTDDITQYTPENTTVAYRPYPFPAALVGIKHFLDVSTGSSAGTTYSLSFSWTGGISTRYLEGFRGDCLATRMRVFSMGPFTVMPTNPNTGLPYSPTIILLANGNVVEEGGASSVSVSDSEETTSNSVSFKVYEIKPSLTYSFDGTITPVGTGNAIANLDYTNSIVKDAGSPPRTGFLQGDIITCIDPPEKLRAISVHMATIWLIVCPYTTGIAPAGRTFTFTGRNGSGNITVMGLTNGDVILFCANLTTSANAIGDFTSPITADNTLAQSSMSDLSGDTFLIGVSP